MQTLRSWISSSSRSPWRQSARVSVGLDLGPDVATWVILSGTSQGPTAVVLTERLTPPKGWMEAGRITQPTALGHWLGQALLKRQCMPTVLSIGVADALITPHRVSLAHGLSQDDLAFQLLAEVQSALGDEGNETDVRIDFRSEALQATTSELTYQVQSVSGAVVRDAQQLARAAGLHLLALMPRAEAESLAQQQVASSVALSAFEPLVADHAVALGLALSAWGEVAFNFLPHREATQRAARRLWQRHMFAACLGGAGLATGFTVTFNEMTDRLQATLSPTAREAASDAHGAAQQRHAQLSSLAQRAHAQASWFAGQQGLQASTLAWHQQLGQAAPGVWLSHVTQKGAQWSVRGEALSSHHAQQWVRPLGALTIWAKPPQLPALQLTPAVSQQGVPVWQFQVDAELKGGR